MVTVSVDEERRDAEAVRERIRQRGERVRQREQERAIRRLRAQGDLSEAEAAAVRELAASLTEALLSVPETRLAELPEADVQEALELFGEG